MLTVTGARDDHCLLSSSL